MTTSKYFKINPLDQKFSWVNLYVVAYMALIAITIFSPDEFGTTLKYAILPLAIMVFFSLFQKRIIGKVFFLRLVMFFFLMVVTLSTYFSNIVDIHPSFRSTLIMIFSFLVLCGNAPSKEQMDKIKFFYILCTLFCGLWVIFSVLRYGLSGVDRNNFSFIWGAKDVNYLLAFMLPGCYMAARGWFVEHSKYKKTNILCVVTVIISVLALQTRAAFITAAIFLFLIFIEYNALNKMSKKKLLTFFVIGTLIIVAIIILFNSPQFARLTDFDSYEDDIRFTVWEEAIKGYYNNPTFGSGLGAASTFSLAKAELESHNNYIDILSDFGIVGAALFSICLIYLCWVKKGKRINMISYLISFMLPLAFINGFQTIVFWLPLIMLAHENVIINSKEQLI